MTAWCPVVREARRGEGEGSIIGLKDTGLLEDGACSLSTRATAVPLPSELTPSPCSVPHLPVLVSRRVSGLLFLRQGQPDRVGFGEGRCVPGCLTDCLFASSYRPTLDVR
ncbi:hypothetical protein E2C01_061279 [Portunus trituberculatus]|uniref:Uncharacterized protein n=1 Tax=Portunus trituberculatus TaxID=210409 RepID=A0A5B7HEL7_PORTR|nr:hypothetical protein [Portunus trituberculatus]